MSSRVLVLADAPGWAWERKGLAYQQYLSNEFDITLAYHAAVPSLDDFDLIHLFEVSQTRVVPEGFRRPVIAGLTAMVWWTWGEETMRRWAGKCVALHGNSRMLVTQLAPFHSRIYYTPNGVDPEYWSRAVAKAPPRYLEFTACHVGKPNPRKGAALIVEACRRAKVPLHLVQRTSQIKYPPEIIRDFYATSHVQISCSDMDGTPNPMLEAAAMGNVLISTPIGNMPEFIQDGENGYLVGRCAMPDPFRPWIGALAVPNPDDLPEWARWPQKTIEARREVLIEEIFMRLTELREKPVLRAQLGHAARQTVLDDWTWERQVSHVATMWRDVLDA